jgi:DNA-binding transcriptional ArsR family regulator
MEQSTETIDTRAVLLRSIEENPGIRYRELLRTTGLVNGVLSYHLSALERLDVIKVDRQPRTTRYYPVTISDQEYNILKFVRHKPVRQIMLFLIEHDSCTFNEIVDHMQKAPSTVSLHLRRLREGGMISIRYGEYQLYSLTNRDIVCEVLAKYKSSFTDRVVDSYEEMMEEL